MSSSSGHSDPEAPDPATGEKPVAGTATPARPARRTRAAALWLALLGTAATIVGGHDTIQGSEITVRVLGTFVLAAGVVLVAGAFGLRRANALGRALAMVSALLGVALGGLMFLAQAVNDEPDGRLSLWAAVIVLSAATAWHIRTLSPADERAEGIWHHLPFLKSAVSIGVLISLGQFWYTSIYVPTTAPASLTLESKLAKVSETATHVTLKGVVTIRNTSDTKVNVLGSSLDVTASDMFESTLDHDTLRKDVMRADQGGPPTERYAAFDRESLLAHGRLVSDGFYFDPGEVVSVPIMTSVPKRRYERARLEARLTIARGRVLAFEQAEDGEMTEIEDGVVVLTPVPEAGWLRQLTRGDRLVRTEYASNIGGPLALSYNELQTVEGLIDGHTRRRIYEDLPYVRTPASFDALLERVKDKLGVRSLAEVPEAYERASGRYTVQFVKKNPPAPTKDCDRSCIAKQADADFDANLRRFYGVADATSTDVLALSSAT